MSADKLGLTANTLITIASGAVIGWFVWSVDVKVDLIEADLQKTMLQSQISADDKYVSKVWFQGEDSTLRQVLDQNSAEIQAVKTDVAVLKDQQQQETKGKN